MFSLTALVQPFYKFSFAKWSAKASYKAAANWGQLLNQMHYQGRVWIPPPSERVRIHVLCCKPLQIYWTHLFLRTVLTDWAFRPSSLHISCCFTYNVKIKLFLILVHLPVCKLFITDHTLQLKVNTFSYDSKDAQQQWQMVKCWSVLESKAGGRAH